MEFACKVAGAKVVMGMGREQCGAALAAIDGVEMGNMGAMLANLQLAIEASDNFAGEKSSSNADFVRAVSQNNITITIDNIRQASLLLSDMESNDEISIVGAYYDLAVVN